jgi:hypothetical protein
VAMDQYSQYPDIVENFSESEIASLPEVSVINSWHAELAAKGMLSETSYEGKVVAWLTYCRACEAQAMNEGKAHADEKLANALLLCTKYNKKSAMGKAIETKRSWFTEGFKIARIPSPLTVSRLVKNWTIY